MSPIPVSASQARSRELLSEGVRRRLQKAILDGTLVAGERLHDEALSSWLGVSRTPIRTALERLTEVGLVEMQPNRYTRVALPTSHELAQALEIYAALTASSIEGAMTGLTESDVAEFRRLLGPVVELARDRGGSDWQRDQLEVADRILAFFLRRSGNPLLLGLVDEVRLRLAFGFLSVGVVIDGEVVGSFCAEILRAVERRDEAAAAQTLTDHVGSRLVSEAGVDSGGVGAGG